MFRKRVRRFTGDPRPQGHLPRLMSDGFGPFFFDDPRSEVYCFICHYFMCFFCALMLVLPVRTPAFWAVGVGSGSPDLVACQPNFAPRGLGIDPPAAQLDLH